MIPADLLAPILERPADDTPRLAAADWLEEHDQPDRAELIRVQCQTARWGCVGGDRSWLHYCRPQGAGGPFPCVATRRRAAELLDSFVPAAAVRRPPGTRIEARYEWAGEAVGRFPDPGHAGWEFRRGLVAVIRPTLADWQEHAPALLAAHPLESVTVSDVPGLVFEVETGVDLYDHDMNRGPWVIRAEVLLTPDDRDYIDRDGGGRRLYWSRAFPDRGSLVADAAAVIEAITSRLRAAAGDRWPTPADPALPRAIIRFEYSSDSAIDVRAVAEASGRVNADRWLGFPPGSLRFLGCNWERPADGAAWRVRGEIGVATVGGAPVRPAAARALLGETLFRDLVPARASVVTGSPGGVEFGAPAALFEQAARSLRQWADSFGQSLTAAAPAVTDHFARLAAAIPTDPGDPAAGRPALPWNSRRPRIPPARPRSPRR